MTQYQLRERLAGVIANRRAIPVPYASQMLLFLNPKNAIQAYKEFVMMSEVEKYQTVFFAVRRLV